MNIAQLPQKLSSGLHRLIDSFSDNTSTVSAAIGGAGGGVTFFVKQYPQLAELVLHTGSICLYSAVGAITGVLFKIITERLVKRVDEWINKNKQS